VPTEKLEGLWTGDTVKLEFAGMGATTMEMTVESISQEEQGLCAVVLSCQKHMLEVTALRQQSGQVIFKSYSGLRVPKKAVHVRADGKVGVYVLEGAHATWKTVEILHDNGENYVVTLDKSSTDHLWPGDEIILTAEDIKDGKVVL
jgi:glucose dehydrogenase